MRKIAVIAGMAVLVSVVAFAAEERAKTSSKSSSSAATTGEQHVVWNAADLKWADAPPGLPPGAKMAVLEGDPTKKGHFTVRMQAPTGYKIPPHTHPTGEHITVISGTMNFGMGEKLDEAAGKELSAGGYISMPAGMAHYAWSSGETIVQIHGMGPFEIKYVNPGDDPRSAKK